jgi:hypothetical protein
MKKHLSYAIIVALLGSIFGRSEASDRYKSQRETSWRDVAGYFAVLCTSAGMGALSGYYDAVHLGPCADKVVEEINAHSHSRGALEKAFPTMYQTSLDSYRFAWCISFVQWFSSWYVRKALVVGVREESQRSWVKRSLGMASFLATWTAYALVYSLLRKNIVPLNTENFRQW